MTRRAFMKLALAVAGVIALRRWPETPAVARAAATKFSFPISFPASFGAAPSKPNGCARWRAFLPIVFRRGR